MTIGTWLCSFPAERREPLVAAYLDAIGGGKVTLARHAFARGRWWTAFRAMRGRWAA